MNEADMGGSPEMVEVVDIKELDPSMFEYNVWEMHFALQYIYEGGTLCSGDLLANLPIVAEIAETSGVEDVPASWDEMDSRLQQVFRNELEETVANNPNLELREGENGPELYIK